MMKKVILIVIMGLSITAQAQTEQTLKISLQQAMELGLHNRFDVKAKQYNIDLSKNNINKSKKAWIPQISAEGNVQYNTQIRATPVPKDFPGFEDIGTIALGAKNVTTFGLSLEQPLFQPGIHADIKVDKARYRGQQEKFRGEKIKIKEQIATAYLNVILKRLQYKIAREEEKRFGKYKNLMQGKYENGTLIKNKYLRAKLDDENAKVKTATLQQNYHIARIRLKHQLNVSDAAQLVLTDSIPQLSRPNPAMNSENAIQNRTEIKQLKIQQKTDELQIKRTRQNALPAISLNGYYAQLYQNDNFRYNLSKWWSPQSYIGLKISIPITQNFRNKNNIAQFRIQKEQLKAQLEQTKSDIHYQVEKTETDLDNARQNMQAANKNYQLSQKIYNNQEKQFQVGAFQYSNLLETERSLHRAEKNYIQKVYAYLNAKIAYEKAIGEL